MRAVRRAVAGLTAVVLAATGLALTAAPASAAESYSVPSSGTWTVDGRGYGHGRGLSQWGAQGAAAQGVGYRDILAFYYPGTTATTQAATSLRVGLAAHTPAATVTLWNPPGRTFTVSGVRTDDGTNAQVSLVQAARRFTVTVSGSTVTVRRQKTLNGPWESPLVFRGTTTFATADGVVVAPSTGSTSGTWYRGAVEVRPTTGSAFDVTNVVPTEAYLRGVVPREVPASWDVDALRAQAVAARSYALWKKAHRGSSAIDICDTTACQVYGGAGTITAAGAVTSREHSRTDGAIADTAREVRTFAGAVAFTEFSSSNGGWTRAGSVPYQVAKADPWTGTAPGDPVTTWTAQLAVSTVQASCPGSGGRLQRLEVLGRDGRGALGGRVTQVRLVCSTGTADITNPAFGLRSTWWLPRTAAPTLTGLRQSTTSVASGGSVSVSAVPNVSMSWVLTVVDARTGRTAATRTGTAAAGSRFTAAWNARTDAGAVVGAGPYRMSLRGTDAAGRRTSTLSATVEVGRAADPPTVAPVPLVPDAGLVPVAPTRLLDTRTTFGSLGAGQRVDVAVTGRAGVPSSGVTAVVLNITAVHASRDTHLRVWPAGAPMPDASVLNTGAGRTQAATVTVAVGGSGRVSTYNAAGTVHQIVDVLGYYTTSGASAALHSSAPVRAYDSRTARTTPVPAGGTVSVDVASALGVPAAGLSAVAVNVTTTRASGQGYVVAYGSGTRPAVSTVNLDPGRDVANRTVVPVVGGKITVAVVGAPTHVVVDISAWFGAPGAAGGARFTPVQPVRLLDTRTATPVGAGRRVDVATSSAVPSSAVAVVGSLVAVSQTASTTHLRAYATGSALPPTSDLNAARGRTQANGVVVTTGTGGRVAVYNHSGSTHVILDVTGYFD